VLNDSLRGVRVVKAFGREGQEIARFERGSAACHDALVSAERTWVTLAPALGLVMSAGAYLVWLAAGSRIIFGGLTPGTLVSFIQYLPMLYGPLQMVSRLNQWLTRSMTAGERVFEILDARPEVAEAPDAVPAPRIAGRIELRDVSFGYEKHSPVLSHVNLEIAAGEMLGLVGQSGAGKSTAVNLISRLYDADEGQVLIDGVDIRRIRTEDLRRQIGVVLQEPYLFAGTVAENIAYARPEASREEVMAAARLANAHGFVMSRPDGYDSAVEEGGGNFSGGEKQRLAIARAILHDPRILILDEATSAVDTRTEQDIQEALARLIRGRTTIAIAHRLSTLRGASRLAVFEKGSIRELGTHGELLAREGIFSGLVKAQAEMASAIAL
jgi:ATP-binding cassette subfamily B protein